MTKRVVNVFKPRIRSFGSIKSMQWSCSSFMNTKYGSTPKEAYENWRAKEQECGGKQRLDKMAQNALDSVERAKEEIEFVDWSLDSEIKSTDDSVLLPKKKHKRGTSIAKLVNIFSVLAIAACASPLLLYGHPYNEFFVLISVIAYGTSLHFIVSRRDVII